MFGIKSTVYLTLGDHEDIIIRKKCLITSLLPPVTEYVKHIITVILAVKDIDRLACHIMY